MERGRGRWVREKGMRNTSAVKRERAAREPGLAVIWLETRCLHHDLSYMRDRMDIIQHVWRLPLSVVPHLYSQSFTFLHLCRGLYSFSDLDYLFDWHGWLHFLFRPSLRKAWYSSLWVSPSPFFPLKQPFSPLVFIPAALHFKGALSLQDTDIVIVGSQQCVCVHLQWFITFM